MQVTKLSKMNVLYYFVVPFFIPVAVGITVVIVSWCFIRKDISKYLSLKPAVADLIAGQGKEEHSSLLQFRLQAHERLIVFTDRLNPSNLFLRLHQPGITAKELQALILNEVRMEYQHNVTQQLYVSSENWTILSRLKEDTLAMINNAIAGLPAEASGVDLSRKVLAHMADIKENPYDLTVELIKKDIHQLF